MKRRLAVLIVFALFALQVPAGWPTSAAAETTSPSTTLVINEVAPRGPNGPLDGFVEFRNVSPLPLDVGEWQVWACINADVLRPVLTFPAETVLAPFGEVGQYLLLAGANLDGLVASDFSHTLDVPDRGGWLVVNAAGVVVDGVGFAPHLPCTEGQPVRQCWWNLGYACSRDAPSTDTDNNDANLTCHSRSPMNSVS